MTSIKSIADQTLSFGTLLGFTVKSLGPQFSIAAGGAQLLIDAFFGGDNQTADALQDLVATQEEIATALGQLGTQLEQDLWKAFSQEHLAQLTADHGIYKQHFDSLLSLTKPVDPKEYNVTYDVCYHQVDGSQLPESLVTWSWVQGNPGNRFDSLPLFLYAATLYLNYMRLGLQIEMTSATDVVNGGTSGCWAHINGNAPPPKTAPSSFSDIDGSVFIARMQPYMTPSVAYAKPIAQEMGDRLAARDTAAAAQHATVKVTVSHGAYAWNDPQKVFGLPASGTETDVTIRAGVVAGQRYWSTYLQETMREPSLVNVTTDSVKSALAAVASLSYAATLYPPAATSA